MQKTLWLLGVLDVLLVTFGLLSTNSYTFGHHVYTLHLVGLAAALAVIAIINFLGFYWVYRELRDAIAASVVVTYIILLACMFNTDVQDALHRTNLGSSMLTSLTTLTATVAGFYFIGHSYEHVHTARTAASTQAERQADE